LAAATTEEIATRVARAVSSGQADSGIIIDRTGFGLSMAANKVPGVRAALVHNVEMARLSREQHDANVLVHRFAGNSRQTPQGNPRCVDQHRL
jgi:ribose 5-phosphate isomerase B